MLKIIMKTNIISFNKKINKDLEKKGILAVYLFGSFAEKTNSQISDIDVAILFDNPKGSGLYDRSNTLYQKIYDILEPVLKKYASEFDIVFLQKASLELQANVVRFGKILFEKNPEKRQDYEERTILEFADFEVIREEFNNAVLARI